MEMKKLVKGRGYEYENETDGTWLRLQRPLLSTSPSWELFGRLCPSRLKLINI
jgi:hypothetical protein